MPYVPPFLMVFAHFIAPHANERFTVSDGNNLQYLINGLMADCG